MPFPPAVGDQGYTGASKAVLERNLHVGRWWILVLAMAVGAAQQPRAGGLYPVDDTSRDHAFQVYVQRLRSAVTARDTRSLRKLTDTEDVVVGREKDDKGWRKFVAKWRPDDRDDGRIWTALSDMLAAGFVREHPMLYLSPYQVWRFPRNLERAEHLVIARDKAILRAAPSFDSASVATLSFDIVRRMGDAVKGTGLGEWIPVRTLDGKAGFVTSRDVVSPVAPRAQFGFQGGRWLLIALEDD
ncbi:MAG: hypothetical protein JNN08_26690 [Bryobacterales bacterium]|nr:hypothetical protein [Bryobacterales bacterium]